MNTVRTSVFGLFLLFSSFAFAAKQNPVLGVDMFNSFEDCSTAILTGKAVSYEPNKEASSSERKGWTAKPLKNISDGEYALGACSLNADVTSPYKKKWVPFLPSFESASKGQEIKMWKCMNDFGDLKPIKRPQPSSQNPPSLTPQQGSPQSAPSVAGCTGECQDKVVNLVLEQVKAKLSALPPAETLKVEQKFPVQITPVFDVSYTEPKVISQPPPVFNVSTTSAPQECINKCWRGPITPGDQVVKVFFNNHPTDTGKTLSGRYCIPRSLASGVFPEKLRGYLNP